MQAYKEIPKCSLAAREKHTTTVVLFGLDASLP